MNSAFAASVITEKTFEEAPEEVPCPYEVKYIWDWFLELHKTRSNSGMAISAITHQEITAWSNGMNVDVLPFEREAIRALDDAYVAYINSKANRERNERE